jgi:hypothetical protein
LRYKQNVRDTTLNSQAIYGLRPTIFDSKDEPDKVDLLGYIAEEVEVCSRDFAGFSYDDKGFEQAECIDWMKILMYTVEEIKVLNQRISNLENNVT